MPFEKGGQRLKYVQRQVVSNNKNNQCLSLVFFFMLPMRHTPSSCADHLFFMMTQTENTPCLCLTNKKRIATPYFLRVEEVEEKPVLPTKMVSNSTDDYSETTWC